MNVLNFEYGEGADAQFGCGATLMGEMWYFGGGYRRQASKIEGCMLVRQGDLDFDFTEGSCNSFLQPNPRILLCFDYYDSKVCHT